MRSAARHRSEGGHSMHSTACWFVLAAVSVWAVVKHEPDSGSALCGKPWQHQFLSPQCGALTAIQVCN